MADDLDRFLGHMYEHEKKKFENPMNVGHEI